jgi:energy-coupling factor transport system permease protein
MKRTSTAYLLTCAAIGVAAAALFVAANWLSTVLFTAAPFVGVALAGIWVLPAVIGLRLLERPFAGLLVGLVSGLVIVPFSGYGFLSIVTNLSWALFAELPFLLSGYRHWKTWQYFLGPLVTTALWPPFAAQTYDLWALPLWAQVLFFAIVLVSCLAATWLGIVVADALRRAGVARTARRRSHTHP